MIPGQLNKVKNLENFNASYNRLHGVIPPHVTKLKFLLTFDVSHNSHTGSIPANITNLRFLQAFNVSYNGLCGKIPQGGQIQSLSPDEFSHNKCLCGAPLEPCK
ncbi:hypothetical protein QJS10_CPA06g01733 [Acorus calamus]|uniref:Uncharacterized protein n=1 Tax=Acorus calamus TaxID=4465 RepID=A0AAV9EI38_ACOCL|nr:hypothetical protein QJS10_CPA06g01733 [Acorus calamus]